MASIGLIEAAVERKRRGQHHDDDRRDDQHDDGWPHYGLDDLAAPHADRAKHAEFAGFAG